MGLRDQLRNAVVGAAVSSLNAVGTGAQAFANWAETGRFDDFLEKAAESAKRAGNDGNHQIVNEPADRKALHFDPFDLVAAMGYRDRPTNMTYATMERVGLGVPVIADIIRTRTNQVLMFCEPPEDKHSPGFEIRLRDRKAKMTKKAEKRAEELTHLMLNCGYVSDQRDRLSLVDFTKMFIPDSLQYDQGTFEVVPDRKGQPSYFDIVDSSTIRLLDPAYRDPGDPFAVQVINGSIVEAFTPDELAFCVRNPRSGIRAYGYGMSEIETLVREITGFLWGMDYNRRFFTQGSATRGVLNFKGTIPDKQLRAFRRQWYAMVSGVSNAWRTPITNAEELQWINMQMSNRDMEYNAWIDFLIKICCARYNIAPEEVNFSYGNTGQSSAMGQAPIEEKIKASKDLGLRPLIRWYFTCLNVHFLQRIDEDFEMCAVGLDDKGAEAEVELLTKQVQGYRTLNEVRADAGDPPLPEDKGGDLILNAQYIQWLNAKQQADMQQQMMGGMDDGMGGEGDDGFGDDFDLEDEIDFGDFGGDDAVDMGGDDAIKSERDPKPVRARYTEIIS